MKARMLALVFITLAVFLSQSVLAETVHLRDGRKFWGTVSEKENEVEIDTGYGLLLIPKTDILRIDGSAAVAPKPPVPGPKTAAEASSAIQDSITSAEMSEHIHYLASEELEGRGTGAAGGKLARDYIVKHFKACGLKPGGDSSTYTQKFPTRQGDSWNVAGYIEGSDPQLKTEVVIVGAHYDHLGIGKRDGKTYPGADDNASGTAGVLEIAESYAEKGIKPRRTVLFICFGAEEIGLVGSRYYCEHPAFPLKNTIAMLNMDMIARNDPDKVIVFGLTLSKQFDEILTEANVENLDIKKSGMLPNSDHYSFYVKGVPAIFFNSGMHKDLHQPTDLPYKCDFRKAERLAELVALASLGTADFDGKIEMEKAKEGENPWGRRRRGPRLGITPAPAELSPEDRKKFGLGETDGALVVNNVRPGSIAEKCGLRAGDIIIELAGEKVPAGEFRRWLHGKIRSAGDDRKIAYTIIRSGEKKTGTLIFP